MDTITRALHERRVSLRLTQAEAADLAGVSERFIRTLETGKQSVQFDKVLALADALGLELRPVLRGTP